MLVITSYVSKLLLLKDWQYPKAACSNKSGSSGLLYASKSKGVKGTTREFLISRPGHSDPAVDQRYFLRVYHVFYNTTYRTLRNGYVVHLFPPEQRINPNSLTLMVFLTTIILGFYLSRSVLSE